MAQEPTDQTGERTFEATPLRLADARKRGQVPRSADLTAAAAGLAALLVLALAGPGLLDEMTSMPTALLAGRGALSIRSSIASAVHHATAPAAATLAIASTPRTNVRDDISLCHPAAMETRSQSASIRSRAKMGPTCAKAARPMSPAMAAARPAVRAIAPPAA